MWSKIGLKNQSRSEKAFVAIYAVLGLFGLVSSYFPQVSDLPFMTLACFPNDLFYRGQVWRLVSPLFAVAPQNLFDYFISLLFLIFLLQSFVQSSFFKYFIPFVLFVSSCSFLLASCVSLLPFSFLRGPFWGTSCLFQAFLVASSYEYPHLRVKLFGAVDLKKGNLKWVAVLFGFFSLLGASPGATVNLLSCVVGYLWLKIFRLFNRRQKPITPLPSKTSARKPNSPKEWLH